jgi:hypothetical protein
LHVVVRTRQNIGFFELGFPPRQRRFADPQITGDLRHSPTARLDQPHRFTLELFRNFPLFGCAHGSLLIRVVVSKGSPLFQGNSSQAIRDGGGDYLFTVKANQPALMADLAVAFGDAFLPGTGGGVPGPTPASRPGRAAAGP